jgi:murein DD-endopeptidase MepM/ murein hydrolase activator NlpD
MRIDGMTEPIVSESVQGKSFSRVMLKRTSGNGGWLLALFAVGLFNAAILVGCAAEGSPRILSHYGSMTGVLGGPRSGRHMGVDFDASRGDPVIAAADGKVTLVLRGDSALCGNGVILQHRVDTLSWWTRYCHMDETGVQPGQEVKRGAVLGKIGTTGRSMGVSHLHFELCPGQPCAREYSAHAADPLPFIVGCFDPAATVAYSALEASGGQPHLVLTYPVRCVSRTQTRPTR